MVITHSTDSDRSLSGTEGNAATTPQFLLDCILRFFQPQRSLQIPAGLDWQDLWRAAEKHAVFPMACWSLNESCRGQIPEPIARQMQERLKDAAGFTLTLSAELAALLALLDRECIRVVPLKGPTLSRALYGSLSLRSFSDLDILIQPGDLPRTKELLEADGYTLASALPWRGDSAFSRVRECEISFTKGLINLDVHWRLLPGYLPDAFRGEDAWRDPHQFEFAGRRVTGLSREHLLLFLCAHGAKHQWERLGWICDVSRFLQVEQDIDWAYAFAAARQTRTMRILSLGVLLASDLLGAAIPACVARNVDRDPPVRKLAAAIRSRFLADAPLPTPTLEAAWFGSRALERTSDRLKYLFGSFVLPSEAEYRTLKLPPALYSLYYIFRPLRLAVKYAMRTAC
jgi:hypothetical protein